MKKCFLFLILAFVFIIMTGCQKNYYNPDKETQAIVSECEQIVLDKTEITMEFGEVTEIKARYLSEIQVNKKISYKSLDTKIVTVDELGKVFSKATGKTTIEITSEDGKSTVKCAVTVHPLRKMKVEGNIPTISDAGKSYTITVMFENCTYPSVKVITDCGGGSIKAENTSFNFNSTLSQYQVFGKTTIQFTISDSKDINNIRIIGFDQGNIIDSKEYTITKNTNSSSNN